MDENLDERAVNELEEILHTKIYPGTEIMKDVGSHHFIKAGGGSDVLVPQPSDDPHDPLNWSPKWKFVAIMCATVTTFSLGLGPLANAPLFGEYVQEWGCSLEEAVQFTGVAILVLGFSNFIWVPISVCFGRRPVLIASALICAVSSVWRARATSYNSFMGASVLNGLAAGPGETLQPQIIADVVFLHDRGKHQTLYFATYFAAVMVGPLIAGAMASNVGWRAFWWLNTAAPLASSLLGLLCFPETRYRRVYESAVAVVGDEKEEEKSGLGDAGAAAAKSELAHVEKEPTDTSKTSPTPVKAPDTETGDVGQRAIDSNPAVGNEHLGSWLGHGQPGKGQFKLFQHYEGSVLRELWIPWYLHLFPIVEFAAFAVSFTASGYLVVNLSQSQAFAAPPYNYSPQTIGLFNLAVLIGAIIGLLTNGPWSDWVAAYLTRRNNGVREPEMRLAAMIPYTLIMILGSVITSVGYDYHWPWQVIVVVGWGCLGIQVAALPSIASTYAIDSYKPVTGSLFVAITVNKNVWGYGVSKFLTPWAAQSGFRAPILVNMALITIFCCSGIIFWFWGKKFRGMTKSSFVHQL